MFSQMLTRGFSPPDKIESQDVISRYLLSVVIENHTWEKIEYIVNLTGKIPSRDTFELTIELEGLDKSITQYNQEQTEELKKHYEEHKDDSEQLIVELKISKDTNTNKISIYDLSSFISFLNSQTLLQKIDTISKRIKNDLVFEVFEKIEEFGSNTIKFIPHTSPSQEPSSARIHDRNKKIESFKENTVLTGLPYQLTADDFQILKKVNIEKTCSTSLNNQCSFILLHTYRTTLKY
ncbi:hypothetical protein M5C90_06100 [Pseudomonas chlororaphis subsp. piscium]|nr:hypothetical protein M5C90_06100 [Pseudomonas chlororaphis subsp. piscium]